MMNMFSPNRSGNAPHLLRRYPYFLFLFAFIIFFSVYAVFFSSRAKTNHVVIALHHGTVSGQILRVYKDAVGPFGKRHTEYCYSVGGANYIGDDITSGPGSKYVRPVDIFNSLPCYTALSQAKRNPAADAAAVATTVPRQPEGVTVYYDLSAPQNAMLYPPDEILFSKLVLLLIIAGFAVAARPALQRFLKDAVIGDTPHVTPHHPHVDPHHDQHPHARLHEPDKSAEPDHSEIDW